MLVMWITRGTNKSSILNVLKKHCTDKLDSVVEYGTSANQLSLTKNGTITTYDAGVFGITLLFVHPSNSLGWSGWIHSVLLTGLSTSTKYYYRCGDPGTQLHMMNVITHEHSG